jgi:hypothetical protein
MIKILGKNANENDWNHVSHQAGLNCWIGKLANGEVTTVQTMPWNYRSWGCGSGSKGSCNNGWIQFEICEDDLSNEEYFNKIYKEGCEITAYLCKMYNLNPKGTVKTNGVNIPVILDHATAYKLGFGSNHGDIQHWFKKYGKTMDNVRNDVAKLMEEIPVAPSIRRYITFFTRNTIFCIVFRKTQYIFPFISALYSYAAIALSFMLSITFRIPIQTFRSVNISTTLP